MKTRISLAVVAALLLASTTQAQKPGAFGVGIGIGPSELGSGGEDAPPMSSIMFPMNFGTFRLEPSLGLARAGVDYGTEEQSLSQITLGVGVYFQSTVANDFLLYGGPRLGIMRSSQTQRFDPDPEQSVTTTDKFVGVAVGGEHLFSSHFSLGAEARITHFIAGEPQYDPDVGSSPDFSASATVTTGILTARFYF